MIEWMRTAKDRHRSLDQHRQFLSDERLPLRHTKMRDGERVTGVLPGTGMDENAERLHGSDQAMGGYIADSSGSFPGQFAQAMRTHIERNQSQVQAKQQRRQVGRSGTEQGQDQSRS